MKNQQAFGCGVRGVGGGWEWGVVDCGESADCDMLVGEYLVGGDKHFGDCGFDGDGQRGGRRGGFLGFSAILSKLVI